MTALTVVRHQWQDVQTIAHIEGLAIFGCPERLEVVVCAANRKNDHNKTTCPSSESRHSVEVNPSTLKPVHSCQVQVQISCHCHMNRFTSGICGFQIITKLSTEPPKAESNMPSLSQHPNGTLPLVLAMLMGISILSIGCDSENEGKQQNLDPAFFEAPGSWRAAATRG